MKTFIHTINVVSENEPERTIFVTDTIYRNGKYRSIYNLNKPNKVTPYLQFIDRCKTEFTNLLHPNISRIDIAWDSEDKEFFEENKKYFRYLLSAFTLAYQSKNSFSVKDLLTDDEKSYWVKCNYFEATFYNKGLQVEGKDVEERTQARFELRLKRLFFNDLSGLKEMIIGQVEQRLNKAFCYLNAVQDEYNKCLIELYKSGNFRKISELVVLYQDRIFTKQQLIKLLKVLDATDTDKEKMAENLIYRYHIKFITDGNMKDFIQNLMKDMQKFMNDSSQN